MDYHHTVMTHVVKLTLMKQRPHMKVQLHTSAQLIGRKGYSTLSSSWRIVGPKTTMFNVTGKITDACCRAHACDMLLILHDRTKNNRVRRLWGLHKPFHAGLCAVSQTIVTLTYSRSPDPNEVTTPLFLSLVNRHYSLSLGMCAPFFLHEVMHIVCRVELRSRFQNT